MLIPCLLTTVPSMCGVTPTDNTGQPVRHVACVRQPGTRSCARPPMYGSAHPSLRSTAAIAATSQYAGQMPDVMRGPPGAANRRGLAQTVVHSKLGQAFGANAGAAAGGRRHDLQRSTRYPGIAVAPPAPAPAAVGTKRWAGVGLPSIGVFQIHYCLGHASASAARDRFSSLPVRAPSPEGDSRPPTCTGPLRRRNSGVTEY
jgi:hypothetical protein